MKEPTHLRNQKGFMLLAVMVITLMLMMTLLVTLQESQSGLKEGAMSRKREVVQAAMDHGVDLAMDRLQEMDPSDLVEITAVDIDRHNIFKSWSTATDFVPPLVYPPTGPYAGQLQIRVGMVPGQKTLVTGEDITNSFGMVVELQLSVRMALPGQDFVEERMVVGLSVPHRAGGG